jgi:hypothetical protein
LHASGVCHRISFRALTIFFGGARRLNSRREQRFIARTEQLSRAFHQGGISLP